MAFDIFNFKAILSIGSGYYREETLMNNVLLKDGNKYSGNYVAMKSFSDRVVINYGKDLQCVYKEAVRRGITDPVVFYVPEKNMVHIY